MAAVTDIPLQDVDGYDYLIVGGGTAGCVIASRLAEYLPEKRILLIEAGPSDLGDNRILDLTHALDLLGGEFDYEYSTVEQPRGNSNILHSRAKVLGGCSSHNGGLSFRPLEYDCRRWEKLGAEGWSFDMFQRVIDNLRTRIHLCHPRHRNPIVKDWLRACSTAHDIPIIPDFNEEILANKQLNEGAGFLSFSYDPETIYRCSASVAYIHPIFEGRWKRPNLTVLTDAWVSRINAKGDVVLGVNITLKSGRKLTLRAKKEVVICAGTIDTPRLLLLSGIGPRKQLEDLSIEVVKDVPGVGENLQDHPETMVLFELNKAVPPNKVVTESDAVVFLRREPENAAGDDGRVADLMMHIFTVPFCVNTERLGYDVPENAFAMTPNVPRSRSRGRIYLTSNDGAVKPALDFQYFTDPEGYDEATVVYGIKAARKIAQQTPFSEWIKREIAPGPHITSDEALSKYARSVAHTVYHPCGTTKMGDVKNDPLAVVDPSLKVCGFKNLRIADAGIFPVVTTINPMLTVLGIGERAAELIAEEAGWKGHELSRL